jgi:hypothetical protein
MNRIKIVLGLIGLCSVTAHAQLAVTVGQAKIAVQKAVIPLGMKNEFSQKIESARAVVFLLDGQGKMVAQSSKWVIGGAPGKPGLAPDATNSFFFVLTAAKPFPGTNLTTKVNFSRVVLGDGKLADPAKDVVISK